MKRKSILVLALCVALSSFLFSCRPMIFGAGKEDVSVVEKISEETFEKLDENEKEELILPSNADTEDITSGTPFLGYINLGVYPQTVAYYKAVDRMSETVDETGYYISEYDNEHYVKVAKAKVYGTKYRFSDEDIIKGDNLYYFKVEPIKWRVYLKADVKGGDVIIYLISDTILDSHAFCTGYEMNYADGLYYRSDSPSVLADNWGYSDLRKWLNDDFIKNAFSPAEREKLVGRETSSVNKNTPYIEQDNTEYVWVPTYAEASLLASKRALTTDYARVRSTFMSIYPAYYGNGRYWTTTAGSDSYRGAYIADYAERTFDDSGNPIVPASLKGESVGSVFVGVRPVISVLLKDGIEILTEEEE